MYQNHQRRGPYSFTKERMPMKYFNSRTVLLHGRNSVRFCILFLIAFAVTLTPLLILSSCNSGSSGDGVGNYGGFSSGDLPGTGDVNSFLSALQSDGFITQEGAGHYIDVLKACSEGFIPSCFGQNAWRARR